MNDPQQTTSQTTTQKVAQTLTKQSAKVTNTANASLAKRKNKYILLGLLVVFVFPFSWAYYLYKNPDSTWLTPGQHGQLIKPPTPIQSFVQQTELPRKWVLVLMTTQQCQQECEGYLNALHRLVRSTGKENERINRWLISPNAEAVNWGRDHSQYKTYQIDASAIQSYIDNLPFDSKRNVVTDKSFAFYLIDPEGRALMIYAKDADFKHIRKDLMRLLKASRIG